MSFFWMLLPSIIAFARLLEPAPACFAINASRRRTGPPEIVAATSASLVGTFVGVSGTPIALDCDTTCNFKVLNDNSKSLSALVPPGISLRNQAASTLTSKITCCTPGGRQHRRVPIGDQKADDGTGHGRAPRVCHCAANAPGALPPH